MGNVQLSMVNGRPWVRALFCIDNWQLNIDHWELLYAVSCSSTKILL